MYVLVHCNGRIPIHNSNQHAIKQYAYATVYIGSAKILSTYNVVICCRIMFLDSAAIAAVGSFGLTS